MTTRYRTRGLILQKRDRSESDKVFNVFTEDFGALELRGKAIRKINSKLKSGLDLFYLSEVEFIEGKNQKTLTDAVVIDRFSSIFENLEKAEAAFKIANMAASFIKGRSKDGETFKLLHESFEKIDRQIPSKNCDLAYYYFIWNFLSNQGYRPEVSVCVLCKSKLNPYGLYFSSKEGGFICKSCLSSDRSAKKVNSDIVKILRIILKKDWQLLSKLKIESSSLNLFKLISKEAALRFLPENV